MTQENMTNSNENKPVIPPDSTADAAAAAVDPLAELQTKLLEGEKKYLYLYAEFENFRKRADRERLDFLKFGHESFLRDLLQVVDNFERALMHAKSQPVDKGSPMATIVQGVEMIQYQLNEILRSQGLTEVKSLGENFNPSFHEAVSEELSADKDAGTILQEHTKGYLLHGRLLRPARVVVAKK